MPADKGGMSGVFFSPIWESLPASRIDARDPIYALHGLIWSGADSLLCWASPAAASVFDFLPVAVVREGYRHDVKSDDHGVVTHQLVEVDSCQVVCLMEERPGRGRIAAFCGSCEAPLLRFIRAIVDGDLLGLETAVHQPQPSVGDR